MPAPYLSVVAAARNDDHGANLLRRLQTFVNALIGQSKRHALPVELVLVEWNPPPEKPPLAEAIQWPADPSPCRVRIVSVAPGIHRRYRHAEALPLYQMIAKNAGIRRAEGEFILATNIDILLSDELMRFLAERRLEPGRLYRIDRHDVDSDVPAEAPVEARLDYCRAHCIRLNAREGTFALTPDGFRKPAPVDILAGTDEIFFGAGWHAPEQRFGQVSRWGSGDAEIAVRPAPDPRAMLLEIEAGPVPFALWLLGGSGAIAEARVEKRSLVRVQVPAGAPGFRLGSGGSRFRALRCQWDAAAPAPDAPPLAVSEAPARIAARAWRTLARGARFAWEFGSGKGPRRIALPLSPRFLERLQLRSETSGVSIALGGKARPEGSPAHAPAGLHTNACGDFTLAARRHWLELRGYPEFDLHSMNLDSVFCYTAHYGGAAEQVLRDPMRIYHIEHATGSGWTPEGRDLLFQRLAAQRIPWLDFDEVLRWGAQMERLQTAFVFNRENWGLADFPLAEYNPGRPKSSTTT
jgi:hypothetical protein